jgi:uncharacterized protein (TIGR00369 family)
LEIRHNNHYAHALGVKVLERGDGSAAMSFQSRPHDLNAQDVVHGGVLAGLMDLILAMAAGSHSDPEKRQFSITLSMNINFVAAARPGTLTCRGSQTGGGRKTVFCEGRIEDESGQLVATGQGTFKLLPPGSEDRP